MHSIVKNMTRDISVQNYFEVMENKIENLIVIIMFLLIIMLSEISLKYAQGI